MTGVADLLLSEVAADITGWILAIVFLLITLGNLGLALRWLFRNQHGSFVPLIGGLAGLGACLMLPFPNLRLWLWIPLIADLGTGYLLTATAVFCIYRLVKFACGYHLD